MTESAIEFRSATQLRADFAAGRLSPVDVMERILARIRAVDGELRSYYTLNEKALEAAREAERAIRRGDALGPLHGIPFSAKDLFATAGVRTTRGSAIFEAYVPDFNVPAVERALGAGAILIGKTSTPEFGWKAVTDCPLFGHSRNPWDPGMTPGGSSGGAAAAVAAGLGPLALATDAAGSTRIPAAYCGVFGIKPSFGRIPFYPVPSADSLVHVGVISRTVRDSALLLSVISGPDERDKNTLPTVPDESYWNLAPSLKGFRVAWCPTFGGLPVDPETRDACATAVEAYQRAGLEVDEIRIDLPDTIAAFRTIFQGLIGAQLADALPKWRDRMDPGLVDLVEAGAKLSAYDLTKANMVRAALAESLSRVFERYAFLLLPVTGTAAFPLGTDVPGQIAGAPAGFPEWLGFLYPFNLTGQPAASIPCGWTGAGLPVGLQIVGRRFRDADLLGFAAAIEQICPWSHRTPPCAI